MPVGAPLVKAEQDSTVGIQDLPKVVMGRKGSRLTEQRLVPLEAARHIANSQDRPRALHRLPSGYNRGGRCVLPCGSTHEWLRNCERLKQIRGLGRPSTHTGAQGVESRGLFELAGNRFCCFRSASMM